MINKYYISFVDLTCSTLVPGSIPTLHLPEKSIPTTPLAKERDPVKSISEKRAVVTADEPGTSSYYKSFQHLCQRVVLLKLPANWNIIIKTDEILTINKVVPEFVVPEYELIIVPILSSNHPLYYNYNRSVNNITVSNLIILLNTFMMCTGVKMFASRIIPHVIQKVFNINYQNNLFPIDQNVYYRSKNCKLLLSDDDVCSDCTSIKVRGQECK